MKIAVGCVKFNARYEMVEWNRKEKSLTDQTDKRTISQNALHQGQIEDRTFKCSF